MPNQVYALEWLALAKRNLETAAILLRENHYTDSIAIEIHMALEKSFKSIYAYFGITILRTHSLTLLFSFVSEKMSLQNIDIEDIIIISDYYEADRYPGPKYNQPSRSEVEHYYLFAKELVAEIEAFLS